MSFCIPFSPCQYRMFRENCLIQICLVGRTQSHNIGIEIHSAIKFEKGAIATKMRQKDKQTPCHILKHPMTDLATD